VNYDILPLKDKIDAYVQQRMPVGNFLFALLSNDLKEAVGRADDTNVRLLREYVIYLYNEIPAACWGSPEKVDAWLNPQPEGA
jgi:hypothetical protein